MKSLQEKLSHFIAHFVPLTQTTPFQRTLIEPREEHLQHPLKLLPSQSRVCPDRVHCLIGVVYENRPETLHPTPGELLLSINKQLQQLKGHPNVIGVGDLWLLFITFYQSGVIL